MTLGPAIPALPISDTAAATTFYRELLGFTVAHQERGFAVLQRDSCVLHLWLADDLSWHDRPDLGERPVLGGAESFLTGTASCRIPVDDAAALEVLYEELQAAEVLHPVSRAGVSTTDHGELEVHALDVDGNLLSFFTRP